MLMSSSISLRDLHDTVNNLLRSSDIKGILSHHKQDQEWIQRVSESSLKMLDSCGNTKEILCLVKGHIQQLRTTFHRASLGETEKKLSEYCFQRKELRKQMLKRLKSLKQAKNTSAGGEVQDIPVDDNLIVVANVLKEVRETLVILLESIMLLMSMPNPNPKTEKKMMIKCNGIFTVKAKFTRLNSLSPWEDCDTQALQSATERLEAVESAMEDLEVELGCIFKRLMRTRVLLLNILTN
ncbi:hypothetical protein HanRHA438_Chr12g0549931 [Helianthus annuus]|uniref:Uncharacterized protein n=2 Tax=Helianthus annuus TaxID=4232 RepID=A0A251T150_HELAN|nr:hypothetical protein HanXRQr2_Chr12g0539001 [Helianthus annuus]KAJ0489214.1 hypothetical protein HanHA300_Chr12g0441501 [Helianthus annuus]KAJ0492948.1 hypothetical protein HanIR_Chr12g0580581 [Helianthus annuus]KAJ0505094.1 hypothetical protein HanHA89_Chr12g0466631 [Helianthus annuus]KAJ0674781.1 hypothetical protein HanLR1_Chr12g0443781 [Helianthus annuus]